MQFHQYFTNIQKIKYMMALRPFFFHYYSEEIPVKFHQTFGEILISFSLG